LREAFASKWNWTKISLSVAELSLFASVIERFLGLSASLNSFVQLSVATSQRKEISARMEATCGPADSDMTDSQGPMFRCLTLHAAITFDESPALRRPWMSVRDDACSFEFFQAVALLQRLRFKDREAVGQFFESRR